MLNVPLEFSAVAYFPIEPVTNMIGGYQEVPAEHLLLLQQSFWDHFEMPDEVPFMKERRSACSPTTR